ncbi:high-affinity choline transporter 1 [Aplysia californica]|uniref:High-affinity choline transporter 1 n=1 Tax=Aplysia californica TaxID=6500 RepID=A0ABM0JD70_APLCA|nr:high-affinity choline transporter 1 [Aplysia californica]
MAVHVPGLIAIIIFYLLILVIGIFAARKTGLLKSNLKVDDVMLAKRSIGIFVGCFSMTATWVGGGYINGTAEAVYAYGLVWCQAPLGYSLSLAFSGYFFAEKMRTSGFTTMLDPFQWKYGDIMSCLLYLPALSGDVFYSASILAALGATLKVILDINLETAIIVSAAISLAYTLVGGLYSVAYTDVVQLMCMFFGLWLCVPFAMTHDATVPITTDSSEAWLGQLTVPEIGSYVDIGLLLILGGIPVQVYWQRALSAKSVFIAECLSFFGAISCVAMSVPPVLLGAVAKSTNWSATEYGLPEISNDDRSLTLPLVMRYLCPPVVTFVGLGAVSAAVMSSTDSSILSSSSMFARNVFAVVYKRITKEELSEAVQVWVMRVAQVVVASLACVMAITVSSVYDLFILCSDFLYVCLFPQLLCVMYLKGTNAYGSFSAFVLGLFFRFMGGESLFFRFMGGESTLGIPAVIKFPWYDEVYGSQMFPFRTLSMLISLFTLILVSYLTEFLFTSECLPLDMDFYGCFQHLREQPGDKRRALSSTNPKDSGMERHDPSVQNRGHLNDTSSRQPDIEMSRYRKTQIQ